MSSQNASSLQRYESNFRNIRGTLAAEGIQISASTEKNLKRIATGQENYLSVLDELRAKYEKRDR